MRRSLGRLKDAISQQSSLTTALRRHSQKRQSSCSMTQCGFNRVGDDTSPSSTTVLGKRHRTDGPTELGVFVSTKSRRSPPTALNRVKFCFDRFIRQQVKRSPDLANPSDPKSQKDKHRSVITLLMATRERWSEKPSVPSDTLAAARWIAIFPY
jgi:hypothetical protein